MPKDHQVRILYEGTYEGIDSLLDAKLDKIAKSYGGSNGGSGYGFGQRDIDYFFSSKDKATRFYNDARKIEGLTEVLLLND